MRRLLSAMFPKEAGTNLCVLTYRMLDHVNPQCVMSEECVMHIPQTLAQVFIQRNVL